MYMIATKSIHNSGEISTLENVLEFIKKKATAKTTQEDDEPNNVEGSSMTGNTNNDHIEEETKKVEMPFCCKSLLISSNNQTQMIHPFLIGEYTMVERHLLKSIYKKKGNRRLYISQQVSENPVLGYSWAVSHSPDDNWGYMVSSKSSACSDMAGPWMVYQKDKRRRNRWTSDQTVSVTCGPEL